MLLVDEKSKQLIKAYLNVWWFFQKLQSTTNLEFSKINNSKTMCYHSYQLLNLPLVSMYQRKQLRGIDRPLDTNNEETNAPLRLQ